MKKTQDPSGDPPIQSEQLQRSSSENQANTKDSNEKEKPSLPLPFVGKALGPYIARAPNELTLVAGKDYVVIDKDEKGNWMRGYDMETKRKGWFPATFVEALRSYQNDQ